MEKRPLRPEEDEGRVEFYEGLVRKTAGKWQRMVGEEYEDLCQTLRMKVVEALASFKPELSRVALRNYVFSCVYNKIKDELKRKRYNNLYIEDVAPKWAGSEDGAREQGSRDEFEFQYLLEPEDQAFAEILQDTPLIPSNLTAPEQKVLIGLYLEMQQKEISDKFGMTVREVGRCVKSIKVKMNDWNPSSKTPGLEGSELVV